MASAAALQHATRYGEWPHGASSATMVRQNDGRLGQAAAGMRNDGYNVRGAMSEKKAARRSLRRNVAAGLI